MKLLKWMNSFKNVEFITNMLKYYWFAFQIWKMYTNLTLREVAIAKD